MTSIAGLLNQRHRVLYLDALSTELSYVKSAGMHVLSQTLLHSRQRARSRTLQMLGADTMGPEKVEFNGLQVDLWPRTWPSCISQASRSLLLSCQIELCVCRTLQMLGADIMGPEQVEFNGLHVELWPRISWSPRWALTFADIQVPAAGVQSIAEHCTGNEGERARSRRTACVRACLWCLLGAAMLALDLFQMHFVKLALHVQRQAAAAFTHTLGPCDLSCTASSMFT